MDNRHLFADSYHFHSVIFNRVVIFVLLKQITVGHEM